MSGERVRAVFFGSGSFAVPILDALAAIPDVETIAVVSAPDRPVGRKAVVTPTPVTDRARELDIPVLQPIRVRRPEAVQQIAELAPDLVVLADYGQLIPNTLLDLPPRGFLNLHPSALPRHRGAAPIPATILAGDTTSAVSLMIVTEEMDAGPIVATEPLPVFWNDTAVTLEERAAGVAAHLTTWGIPSWLAGELSPAPQPEDGVTTTRPLRREDGLMNPERTVAEIERQVRAYTPWPGTYLVTELGRLIVHTVHLGERKPSDVPGLLVRSADGGLALAVADGRVILEEVQLAGGKRMTSADLLRGYPSLLGERVAPVGV